MKIEWLPQQHKFLIDEWSLKRFRSAYSFFDNEILKMEMWVLSNWVVNGKKGPGQKKNWDRFVVNWLNRVKALDAVAKPTVPLRDRKKEELEWREKFQKAIKDAAPPSDDFRLLMEKLKKKGFDEKKA